MSMALRCRHPNLLQFISATNDDGSALFVMELFDTDVRNVLSQRSLHHEELLCLALDVAVALNYLHLIKPFPIIHRDMCCYGDGMTGGEKSCSIMVLLISCVST